MRVVPKGAAFMPGVSLRRLTKAHKKEKAGKPKYMLHAALLRKEGKSIRKISRMLGVAYSTVRDWLVRMHAGNLKRRFDRKRRGRARMISRQVRRNIKRWLGRDPSIYGYEAGSWQMVMIQDMLYKKFRIRCKTGTLRRTLKRIRFSYRKPRPVPYNSATPEEQERFKVETNRLVSEATKEGFTVLTCDERGWYVILACFDRLHIPCFRRSGHHPRTCHAARPTTGRRGASGAHCVHRLSAV